MDDSNDGWYISSTVKKASDLHHIVNDNIKDSIVVDIDPIVRILSVLL